MQRTRIGWVVYGGDKERSDLFVNAIEAVEKEPYVSATQTLAKDYFRTSTTVEFVRDDNRFETGMENDKETLKKKEKKISREPAAKGKKWKKESYCATSAVRPKKSAATSKGYTSDDDSSGSDAGCSYSSNKNIKKWSFSKYKAKSSGNKVDEDVVVVMDKESGKDVWKKGRVAMDGKVCSAVMNTPTEVLHGPCTKFAVLEVGVVEFKAVQGSGIFSSGGSVV